jgi:hypothetical protein
MDETDERRGIFPGFLPLPHSPPLPLLKAGGNVYRFTLPAIPNSHLCNGAISWNTRMQ